MKNTTINPTLQGDIHDSPKDKPYLQTEEIIMDLPDVEDIPGQENIHPPKMNSFADVTISSDDEEGVGIPGFDDLDEDDEDYEILTDDSNVTADEAEVLENSSATSGVDSDEDLEDADLDNEDFDGDELNEDIDETGEDLDVPGSEDDDELEEIGEEDEENNSYSIGGDKD